MLKEEDLKIKKDFQNLHGEYACLLMYRYVKSGLKPPEIAILLTKKTKKVWVRQTVSYWLGKICG